MKTFGFEGDFDEFGEVLQEFKAFLHKRSGRKNKTITKTVDLPPHLKKDHQELEKIATKLTDDKSNFVARTRKFWAEINLDCGVYGDLEIKDSQVRLWEDNDDLKDKGLAIRSPFEDK